jgi:hypothetical protein
MLQTSNFNERPKHRLETIMLFTKKSDLKNHLSAKHSTFVHKVIAKPIHAQPAATDPQKTMSPERDQQQQQPRT